jgi:hypothetical protein
MEQGADTDVDQREPKGMRLRVLLVSIAAVCAAVAGTVAGPAAATSGCGISQTFSAWGDTANYLQMSGKNSTATSGAQINDASGTAAYTGYCISSVLPQVRLFAQNTGNPSAGLRVSVIYTDTDNVKHVDTLGTLTGAGYQTMQPSSIFTFGNFKGNIVVALTPVGTGGNWNVPGVYLDPFCAR